MRLCGLVRSVSSTRAGAGYVPFGFFKRAQNVLALGRFARFRKLDLGPNWPVAAMAPTTATVLQMRLKLRLEDGGIRITFKSDQRVGCRIVAPIAEG